MVAGLADERFLILPHPEVADYVQRKAADPDRWLAGMRRLQARIGSVGDAPRSDELGLDDRPAACTSVGQIVIRRLTSVPRCRAAPGARRLGRPARRPWSGAAIPVDDIEVRTVGPAAVRCGGRSTDATGAHQPPLFS